MPSHYCFTFSSIELTVRYCDNQANDLDLIGSYVHLGLQRAKNLKQINSVRSAHMRVINTLLDTLCDSNLPLVWREHCYLYIKRLLPLMFEMLSRDEYDQKTTQINAFYHYFISNQLKQSPQKSKNHNTSPINHLIKRGNL